MVGFRFSRRVATGFAASAFISQMLVTVALAATAGPSHAGSGAEAAGAGTIAWNNESNITADDTNYATSVLTTSATSEYLQGTNYGFAIPANATINGITVEIMRQSSANTAGFSINDVDVNLLKAGVIVGTDKASGSDWPTSMTAATYGGPADLWGTTWTPAQINASNFGVSLSVQNESFVTNRTASVDYMTITVTWSQTAQTINVGTPAPASATYGDTFTVAATATSGLPVTVTTTGGCTNVGNLVTMTSGSTSCVVHYNQAGDSSYSAATEVTNTVTALPKALTVTPDPQTKLYGDADPVFTVTATGLVGADTVGTVITGSPARTMLELVGSYPFTVGTLATNANYTMSFNAGNALTINPKPLTLTADNQTRAYGTANPALTYTTTPFAFAETIASLGGTLLVSTTAGVNSVIGTYPISISGVTSTNYAITFTPGTLTVTQGMTTTNTIVDTPTPNSEVGTSVQLDATVNGYNPTGTVTFYSGATVLGTASVVSNVATINHTFTLAGNYTINAVYGGDSNNTGSTGSTSLHIVDKDAAHTITTLSSTNPQIVGQNITFTATVTGAYGPTGTVQFYDGMTLLGSDTLDGSFQADFTTNTLTVGSHTISAFYLGDSNNNDSSASTQVNVSQTIDKDTPDTVTTVSATNPQIVGQNVTFTATVAGAFNPTGTVEFYDGATLMGTGSLNGSFQATYTTNALTVGSHTISAFYLGDSNNNDSTGSTQVNVSQTIDKDSPSTSTVLDVFDPSTIGDPVTLSATVSGGFGPTGDVEFFANGSSLGTAPLVGNTATLIVSTLAVGTHTLEAEYLGDGNNNGSSSPSVEMHVVQQMTSTSLFASLLSPNSVHVALSMNVTVTGYNPTGIVEFYQNGVLVGAAPLVAGHAFLQTLPPLGSHTMHAVYLGDINNTTSTSGSQSVQIIDTPDNSGSEDGGGAAGVSNGSGRGSGAGNLSSLAAFTAGTYGFDQSAPPAFGGDDAPLSTQELSYICSMQRAIGSSASDEVTSIVADIMSQFMGRPADFLAEQLSDPVLCAGITMSLRSKTNVAAITLTPFPVDREGNPVSSNATWNSCILGYVTLEEIRANPDRNEYRRAGVSNPLTCGHYVTKGVWKHPDLDMHFSFDRATKLLTLPEGYFAVIKEYATR